MPGSALHDDPYLQTMNCCLRDLLSLWFSVGFLTLERITWQSSCDILQKVGELIMWYTSFTHSLPKGLCKEKLRDYYGSGWVGPGLTRNFFCGKSSQNSPKPVLIFWSSIPSVFCLYIYIAKSCWLLWLECSVHVSDGFQKKKVWMGGGWGELYPSLFLEFVELCKAWRTNSWLGVFTIQLEYRERTRSWHRHDWSKMYKSTWPDLVTLSTQR